MLADVLSIALRIRVPQTLAAGQPEGEEEESMASMRTVGYTTPPSPLAWVLFQDAQACSRRLMSKADHVPAIAPPLPLHPRAMPGSCKAAPHHALP